MERNEEILRQLRNRELDNVKIVLVIGPTGAGKTSLVKLLTDVDLGLGHTLDSGTVLPNCVFERVGGEPYVFIDSPGFGHASSRPGEVKKQIHAMLGFFTRALGGIHGILYVQDITVDRITPAMQEAIDFLDALAGREIRPHITFITTKWDTVVPKVLRKYEQRENEFKRDKWANFEVGNLGGSRYFHHGGVDCEVDTKEEQQHGRRLLLTGVMDHYKDVPATSLVMPFLELTHRAQALKVAVVAAEGVKVAADGVKVAGRVAGRVAGEGGRNVIIVGATGFAGLLGHFVSTGDLDLVTYLTFEPGTGLSAGFQLVPRAFRVRR